MGETLGLERAVCRTQRPRPPGARRPVLTCPGGWARRPCPDTRWAKRGQLSVPAHPPFLWGSNLSPPQGSGKGCRSQVVTLCHQKVSRDLSLANQTHSPLNLSGGQGGQGQEAAGGGSLLQKSSQLGSVAPSSGPSPIFLEATVTSPSCECPVFLLQTSHFIERRTKHTPPEAGIRMT